MRRAIAKFVNPFTVITEMFLTRGTREINLKGSSPRLKKDKNVEVVVAEAWQRAIAYNLFPVF
jgi:hypothetical protein